MANERKIVKYLATKWADEPRIEVFEKETPTRLYRTVRGKTRFDNKSGKGWNYFDTAAEAQAHIDARKAANDRALAERLIASAAPDLLEAAHYAGMALASGDKTAFPLALEKINVALAKARGA